MFVYACWYVLGFGGAICSPDRCSNCCVVVKSVRFSEAVHFIKSDQSIRAAFSPMLSLYIEVSEHVSLFLSFRAVIESSVCYSLQWREFQISEPSRAECEPSASGIALIQGPRKGKPLDEGRAFEGLVI
jgi:hypothetical protein